MTESNKDKVFLPAYCAFGCILRAHLSGSGGFPVHLAERGGGRERRKRTREAGEKREEEKMSAGIMESWFLSVD